MEASLNSHVPTFKEILNTEKISHFPPRIILDIHGELFEYCRNNIENCGRALFKWKELLDESESKMRSDSLAYVYYYLYAHYWTIKGAQVPEAADDWYNYCHERSIYCLRRSISSFNQMKPEDTYDEMIDQILTNLGAELADMGRNVEALKYFQWVLELNNRFNMAIGNKGICLLELAQSAVSEETQYYLLQTAKASLETVQDDHIVTNRNFVNFTDALDVTKDLLYSMPRKLDGKYEELIDFPDEMEQSEKDYRNWALQNKLFLNLLCESNRIDEAASDNLTLYKSRRKKDSEFQKFNGYYNHIIEKFTISRWFFYDGIHPQSSEPHFSEKRITYTDLGDESIVSGGKQKIFASFMLCYAILDKLALFINEYFNLKIVERSDLNLRNLWYQDFPHNKDLRKSIKKYIDNPHLKALYWLSKDVYYREQDEEILEPSARDWRKIRNHLTHEFIRVTENGWEDSHLANDPNSYNISYKDLQDRCLSMLQLIRDSIVYLTLAVSHEELKFDSKQKAYTYFESQFSGDAGDFSI
ncbi:MAG: repeat-containing protein [Bacillales bacterium]|nr:repeat-containing protein [Bacillales bacterium]